MKGERNALRRVFPAVEVPEEIIGLVREREEARKNKDWARADEIRAEVSEAGYTIEDGPEGSKVKPADAGE